MINQSWEISRVFGRDAEKVLENDEAMVIYLGDSKYMAVEKNVTYGSYGDYYKSTTGTFKRCKKAFEKYSPNNMKALGIA